MRRNDNDDHYYRNTYNNNYNHNIVQDENNHNFDNDDDGDVEDYDYDYDYEYNRQHRVTQFRSSSPDNIIDPTTTGNNGNQIEPVRDRTNGAKSSNALIKPGKVKTKRSKEPTRNSPNFDNQVGIETLKNNQQNKNNYNNEVTNNNNHQDTKKASKLHQNDDDSDKKELLTSAYEIMTSSTTAKICTCSVIFMLLLCIVVIPKGISGFGSSDDDVVVIEPIFLEAENATVIEDAEVKTRHDGYTGAGYVDFIKQGGRIEWDINIEHDAVYDVTFRYAAANHRPCDLYILDLEVPFDFEPTGGWKVWSTETRQVFLKSGFYIFNLLASRSNGANIDSLTLVPTSQTSTTNTAANDHSANQGGSDDKPSDNNNHDVVPPPVIDSFATTVVLENSQNIKAGDLKASPNGKYRFGLDNSGDLVLLEDNNSLVWHANVKGGARLYLQKDGNLIVRKSDNTALWSSNTHGVPNARLVLDDGGRAAVVQHGIAKWLAGKPRGVYKGPSSPDLQFPVRGAFYYAWYKETWTVNGKLALAEPTLSYYRSDDPVVVENHIDTLDYAHVDLSIVSWWGQEATLEAPRLTLLLDKTREMNSNLKWSVYYEDEKDYDYPPEIIKSDLDYLKKNYAWHPSFAHVDGKPVIFVYNEGGGCEIVTRWKQANVNNEWYVVLKLFRKYKECQDQPDSWHEYGPGSAFAEHPPFSTAISPGFWRADKTSPLLPRISFDAFRTNVIRMVENDNDWQLLTTFNEHGEGTALESCEGWESSSGYGVYMDILHEIY